MRSCPRCGLISPDQSLYCQCGFDLVSDVRSELDRERVGWRASAKTLLWTGILVAGLGTALSLATYLTAGVGDRFYVFTGMIVAGVVFSWRGYTRLRNIADVEATTKEST